MAKLNSIGGTRLVSYDDVVNEECGCHPGMLRTGNDMGVLSPEASTRTCLLAFGERMTGKKG